MAPKKKGTVIKPKAKGKDKTIDTEKEAAKKAAMEKAEEKKKAQRNALGQLINATFEFILCMILFVKYSGIITVPCSFMWHEQLERKETLAKHKSKEKILEKEEVEQLEAKIQLLERYRKATAGDPEKDELLEKFKTASKSKNWVSFVEGYEKNRETEKTTMEGWGSRLFLIT